MVADSIGRVFMAFFERIPVDIASSEPPRLVSVDIVNGCCMMISRRVFERIGLIDERFFLIHEESDFCLRALQAGFECGIVAEPLVWHKGSSTFKRTGKGLQRYYDARNLFLLLWKHRGRRGGRTELSSWFQYLKYVYYRFSIEREQDEEKAADAVLSGLCDALAGRFGPQRAPARLALASSRLIFRIAHTLCRMRPKNRGTRKCGFVFVKPGLAWPRSSGHDVHCYHMMEALANRGHRLALATLAPPQAGGRGKAAVRDLLPYTQGSRSRSIPIATRRLA